MTNNNIENINEIVVKDLRSNLASLPTLLTTEEVIALLRISKNTLYRLIEARAISFHKTSASLRFFREDVITYIENGRVEVMDDKKYSRHQ